MTKNRYPRPNDPQKQIYYKNEPIEKYTSAYLTESDYMVTEVWKRIQKQVLVRDDYTCKRCESGYNLQVHHIRYPEVWGEEKMDDLITLCAKCHREIHKK